jgi:SAM-dependent methyltransferase
VPARAAGIGGRADAAGLLAAVRHYYAGFVKALAAAAAGRWAVELVAGEGDAAEPEGFAEALGEYDPATLPGPGYARDLLGLLYERLFPRRVRHGSGEYYTPEWLAGHVLDGVGYDGDPGRRLLDPACGSGTFLIAAINRIRRRQAADGNGGELCRRIAGSVTGFELNPLAAMAAKANYAIAMRDLLPGSGVAGIPVRLRDTVLTPPEPDEARADFVVGNPPWVGWDDLPAAYRERAKPACARYGLFSLPASAARHGGGKKDLSMLLLYAAADGWLRDGGRLGFVITQSLFQTKGAGDGFRRFRLGADGPPLGVYRVDDMAGLRLFGNTASRASVVFLRKGEETRYPVRYVRWMREPSGGSSRVECEARPVDPGRPGSQWIVAPSGGPQAASLVGRADYEAHLGANTGGANGVYWVEGLERRGAEVLVRNMASAGSRTVPAVVLGGVGTLVVIAIWAWAFPELRNADQITA